MPGVSRILAAFTSASLAVSIFLINPSAARAQQSPTLPVCTVSDNKMCSTSTSCSASMASLTGENVLYEKLFPKPAHAASGVISFDPKKTEAEKSTPTPSQAEVKKTVETASVAVTASVSPTVTQNAAPGASLNAETVFTLVNDYRSSIGLAPFERSEELCQIAVSRGPELAGEIASGRLHSGLYSRDIPYWVTENMKYGGNEQEALRWWLNSPIHRASIEGDYKYSCTFCTGDICIQLFSNFTPK